MEEFLSIVFFFIVKAAVVIFVWEVLKGTIKQMGGIKRFLMAILWPVICIVIYVGITYLAIKIWEFKAGIMIGYVIATIIWVGSLYFSSKISSRKLRETGLLHDNKRKAKDVAFDKSVDTEIEIPGLEEAVYELFVTEKKVDTAIDYNEELRDKQAGK